MSRKPVIIDTDPGIDDAVALAIALFAEELDVRLITTVGGNVGIEHTTDNALKLVSFFGKHVPVAQGASEPLVRELVDASNVHGASGMEGWEFDEPDRSLLLEKNAVDAMRDALLSSEEPVTIVALAPLTNVALTLKAYPEVKSHIERIVLMGGTAARGNKGVLSEFNVATDPETAACACVATRTPLPSTGLSCGPSGCASATTTARAATVRWRGFSPRA